MQEQSPEPEMFEGEIIEEKENKFFAVRLEDGRELTCHVSGKICYRDWEKSSPKVGDRVNVEVSPYDPEKGRIRYFYRKTARKKRDSKASAESRKEPDVKMDEKANLPD